MEWTDLSFPSHSAEYAGIVTALFLLWLVFGRKPRVSRSLRAVSPPSSAHPRRAQRHPVVLPIALSWELTDARGMTKNLSLQGCRVKSDSTPPVGHYVSVKLYLQTDEFIAIEMAVVRWVLGQDFGLEFLSLNATEWQRLSDFL